MAAALEPALIKRREVRHLTVELCGLATRGQTVVDWSGAGGSEPNAEIVLEMDQPGFIDFMMNGLK
jgi:inosine-uridine nucleoside N-ribohydrolase